MLFLAESCDFDIFLNKFENKIYREYNNNKYKGNDI